MTGPGDALLAEDAFADCAELFDGGDRTGVADVDPELDAVEAAGEGAVNQQLLDAAVEAGAACGGREIGAANLHHAVGCVDVEIARHADQRAIRDQRERAAAGIGAHRGEAGVEPVGRVAGGEDLPHRIVGGAERAQRFAVAIVQLFEVETGRGKRCDQGGCVSRHGSAPYYGGGTAPHSDHCRQSRSVRRR